MFVGFVVVFEQDLVAELAEVFVRQIEADSVMTKFGTVDMIGSVAGLATWGMVLHMIAAESSQ